MSCPSVIMLLGIFNILTSGGSQKVAREDKTRKNCRKSEVYGNK